MLASSQSRLRSVIPHASPAVDLVRQSALDRCNFEQEQIRNTAGLPAWLATLGIEDWEMEKRLIANPSWSGADKPTAREPLTEART